MGDRPWTPGPWRAYAYPEAGPATHRCVWAGLPPWPPFNGDDVQVAQVVTVSEPDAELIALAPELAEAVLGWDADDEAPLDLARNNDLIRRLRRIGGGEHG